MGSVLSSRQLIIGAAEFQLEECPSCGMVVALKPGETMAVHREKHHPGSSKTLSVGWEDRPKPKKQTPGKAYVDPSFQAIEDFKYKPSWDEDEDEETDDAFGNDCPECGTELEIDVSGDDVFASCPKCQFLEILTDDAPLDPDVPGHTHVEWVGETNSNLEKYKYRKNIQFDWVTPQIGLGDACNGWIMRDKGTAAPFDAILNVSQHEYTPPPDAQYRHIYIDEYDKSTEARQKRQTDFKNAVDQLAKWLGEGKKVYVHCSVGMNRSPSVVAGALMKTQGMDIDKAIDLVEAKRDVAHPMGEMMDTLRKEFGLPPRVYKPHSPMQKDRWDWQPEKQEDLYESAPKWKPPKEGLSKFEFIKTASLIGRNEIADMYLLSLIYPRLQGSDKSLADFRLDEIKQSYLQSFRKLMEYQLKKYIGRGRTTPGVPQKVQNIRTMRLDAFPTLFEETFRSDMERINERWVKIAQAVANLERAGSNQIIFALDTLNSQVHNSKELVLTKFPGGQELLELLNFKFSASPRNLLPHASREIASIAKPYITSGSVLGQVIKPFIIRAKNFIKTAITKGKLYNFYVVMQIPPAFYRVFPQWEKYASDLAGEVAEEYAEWLEKLVRTEADHTVPHLSNYESEEEEHHTHRYGDDENGDTHSCSECGYDEKHDWTDADADAHSCSTCGATGYHDFSPEDDDDHICGECKARYSHVWFLSKNQGYVCTSAEYDGEYKNGCGERSNHIPEDEEALFAGDYEEVNHKHNWQIYPIYNEDVAETGLPVRCDLCGRAFVDTQANEQYIIPNLKKKQTDFQLTPYQQQHLVDKAPKWQDPQATDVEVIDPSQFKEPSHARFLSVFDKIAAPRRRQKTLPGMRRKREIPPVRVDTSDWFEHSVKDEGTGRFMPWKTMRENFKPSEWWTLEKSMMASPENYIHDPRKLAKFKYLIKTKSELANATPQRMRMLIKRYAELPEYSQGRPHAAPGAQAPLDPDDTFLSIFGLQSLWNTQNPDEDDAKVYQELKVLIADAWDTYRNVLKKSDPAAAQYHFWDTAPPTPKWSSGTTTTNLKAVGKGQPAGQPGRASGAAAFTSQSALALAGKGSVVLMRNETTPEDIEAMTVAVAFCMARGGTTSHAALVSRQMGKVCVVSAGFSLTEEGAKFDDVVIKEGDTVMIDGASGDILYGVQEAAAEVKDKVEDETEEDSKYNKQFAKIISLDKLVKNPETVYDTDDLRGTNWDSIPLEDLAQMFATGLNGGAWGGPRWALATVRVMQLQNSINQKLPWRYQGMIVDQINTLQHNTGNIFANKPWPGKPASWINEVLDTKATEHALNWMEEDGLLDEKTKALLKDYSRWAKRNGQPQIYSTNLTEDPILRNELRAREEREVRIQRAKEQNKWASRRGIGEFKTNEPEVPPCFLWKERAIEAGIWF